MTWDVDDALANANVRSMNEEFEDVSGKFQATFLFPEEVRKQFDRFVKERGKDELVNYCIEKIKENYA